MSPRRTRRAAAGGPGAPDMPGPPSVEVAARHVRTGDDWSATLAVTGYPAEVSAGWLEPLLSYPGRLDVTLHIEPEMRVPVQDDRLKPCGLCLRCGWMTQRRNFLCYLCLSSVSQA